MAEDHGVSIMNTAIVPTLPKIREYLKNYRERNDNGLTDMQKVINLLTTDEGVKDITLYPKEDKDMPTGESWVMVFTSKTSLSDIDKYGRHCVGLDGCFTTNVYRCPTYVVSVLDDHNNASPGAIIVASNHNAELISKAIEVVQANVGGEKWEPELWMIDKDTTEALGLENLMSKGVLSKGDIMLCQFHVVRTWARRICKSVKGPKWKEQHTKL